MILAAYLPQMVDGVIGVARFERCITTFTNGKYGNGKNGNR